MQQFIKDLYESSAPLQSKLQNQIGSRAGYDRPDSEGENEKFVTTHEPEQFPRELVEGWSIPFDEHLSAALNSLIADVSRDHFYSGCAHIRRKKWSIERALNGP